MVCARRKVLLKKVARKNHTLPTEYLNANEIRCSECIAVINVTKSKVQIDVCTPGAFLVLTPYSMSARLLRSLAELHIEFPAIVTSSCNNVVSSFTSFVGASFFPEIVLSLQLT